MKVYRVIKDEESLLNEDTIGENSFNYEEGTEYLHFFILPENANTYQRVKYYNQGLSSTVYQCDIPYEILKDNFGVGMYLWYYEDHRTAFLECRIKKQDFKEEFIVDKAYGVPSEWENKHIYYRFLKNCVDFNNALKNNIGEKIELNENFNFLDYFPKGDLEKEDIDTSNYPKDINFEDVEYFKLMYDSPTKTTSKFEQLKEKLHNFYSQKIKQKKK